MQMIEFLSLEKYLIFNRSVIKIWAISMVSLIYEAWSVLVYEPNLSRITWSIDRQICGYETLTVGRGGRSSFTMFIKF